MLDRCKKDAVLQWLECCGAKVGDLSELENGVKFLELLSVVDETIDIENISPAKRFQAIEDSLCALHSTLPQHFLVPWNDTQKAGSQLTLATTAVLVLSALFVRAASSPAKHSVAPVMALEGKVQEEIEELLQIVTSPEDDVITNLQNHLQVQSDDESPIVTKKRPKRRKDQSFTFSPSTTRSPLKRMSPVQAPQTLLRNKDQQIKNLRRQLASEEMRVMDLEKELTDIRASAAKSSKEVSSLKTEVSRLRSSDDSRSDLDEEVERLRSRISFLHKEVHHYQSIAKDYDDVIRENVSLKAMAEGQLELQCEVKQLKTSLSEIGAEKLALETQVDELIQLQGTLEAKLDEKNKELEAVRDFYSSKSSPKILQSPDFPGTPVKYANSCFVELCRVELEETKDQLQEAKNANALLVQDLEVLKTKEAAAHSEALKLSEELAQSQSTSATLARDLSAMQLQVVNLEQALAVSKTSEENLEHALQEKVNQMQVLDEEIASMRLSFQDICNHKDSLEKVASEQAETITKFSNTAGQLHHQNELLNEECKRLVGGLEEKAAQVLDLQSTVARQHEEMLKLENSSVALKDLITTLQADNTKLNSQLCGQVQQNSEKAEALSQMECSIRELHGTVSSLQGCLIQVKGENSTLKTDLEALTSEKSLLEKALEEDRRKAILLEHQASERNDACNALHSENEELRRQIGSSLHTVNDLQKAASELKETNGSLEKRLETAMGQVEMLSGTVSSVELSLQEKVAKCEELQSECNALENQVCSLRQDNEQMKRTSAQLREENEVIKCSYSEAKNELASVMGQCGELQQEVCNLQETLSQLASSYDTLQSEHEQLKFENSTLKSGLEAVTSEKHLLERKLEDYRKKSCLLENKLSERNDSFNAICKENEGLQKRIDISHHTINELRKTVSELNDANGSLEKRLGSATGEVETVSSTLSSVELHLQKKIAACEKLQSECSALEGQVCLLKQENERMDRTSAELREHCDATQRNYDKMKKELESMSIQNKELKQQMHALQGSLAQSSSDYSALQSQLCRTQEQYEVLAKSASDLQHENAAIQRCAEDSKRDLSHAQNVCTALKQDVDNLQQTVTQLTNEKGLLQAALTETERQKSLIGSELAVLSQTFQEENARLRDSSSAAEQTAALLKDAAKSAEEAAAKAHAELGNLQTVFCELQLKLGAAEEDRDKALSELSAVTSDKDCLRESLDKLECQHQTLCDQFGDLERKLQQEQEMHNRSEEEYCKCVEEKEKQKDELNKKIEALTKEANETTIQCDQLAEKYEELEAQLRESELKTEKLEDEKRVMQERLSSAMKVEKEFEELKPHLSSLLTLLSVTDDARHHEPVEYSLHHLQAAVAKCKDLRDAKDKLTAELEKEKQAQQKMSDGLLELRAEVDVKFGNFKKDQKELAGQRDLWKQKYDQAKTTLENREALFSKLAAEMRKNLASSEAEMKTLKDQVAEQCSRLGKLEDERDRAVCDNFQLKARLQEVLRERASSTSSTTSSKVAEFREPMPKDAKLDVLRRPHNASITQAAALNSSILLENRFSCDEEADDVIQSSLSDLQPIEPDPFGRYSELQRRNSMVPPHLKSYYPAETQCSSIPATPLKKTDFNFDSLADTATKRKRSTASTSSGDTAGSTTGSQSTATESQKKTPKRTPRSIQRFIRKRFHKD